MLMAFAIAPECFLAPLPGRIMFLVIDPVAASLCSLRTGYRSIAPQGHFSSLFLKHFQVLPGHEYF